MRVHNYSNPTNRCPVCRDNDILPVGCCDRFTNLGSCEGADRCDNAFFYCLRELGSPPDEDPTQLRGLCGFHTREGKISQQNVDGEDIDFSQDNVLGLENPISLSGISSRWTVSLFFLKIFHLSLTSRVFNSTLR